MGGRRADGPGHVERLEGNDEAKRRLEIILETIGGRMGVSEACEQLGVSASRFHELRHEALQAALAVLEPRPPGRPRAQAAPLDPDRWIELERDNRELRLELQATRVRTEIAMVMPHLLTKQARVEIKKKARRARGALRRGRAEDGSDT